MNLSLHYLYHFNSSVLAFVLQYHNVLRLSRNRCNTYLGNDIKGYLYRREIK
jgi:hypothetical protein